MDLSVVACDIRGPQANVRCVQKTKSVLAPLLLGHLFPCLDNSREQLRRPDLTGRMPRDPRRRLVAFRREALIFPA